MSNIAFSLISIDKSGTGVIVSCANEEIKAYVRPGLLKAGMRYNGMQALLEHAQSCCLPAVHLGQFTGAANTEAAARLIIDLVNSMPADVLGKLINKAKRAAESEIAASPPAAKKRKTADAKPANERKEKKERKPEALPPAQHADQDPKQRKLDEFKGKAKAKKPRAAAAAVAVPPLEDGKVLFRAGASASPIMVPRPAAAAALVAPPAAPVWQAPKASKNAVWTGCPVN